MANLKGSTFQKQRKDMNFKLFALGTKKQGDSLTHSEALLTKRDMYFNDFADYMESQGIQDKWNLLLNEENLNGFLEQRLNGLALSTVENYLSGFNSLLTAFKEVNIAVGVSQNYLKDKFNDIKQTTPKNLNIVKRGLQSNTVLNDLKNIKYESYVIGKLMLTHGYRINEAMKIVHEPQKYIRSLPDGDYNISGVSGKGGKIYHDKILNHADMQLIKNMANIPSKSAFHRDLKQVDSNLRAHDFRYQYAKNLFNEKLNKLGYDRAIEIVSKSLNHNRTEISLYYIKS